MKAVTLQIKSQLRFIREYLRHQLFFKPQIEQLRDRIADKKVIVLSNDCVGGLIMHDFELPVYTPMVNIYYSAEDFLKICSNPSFYFSQEVVEIKGDEPHPLGKCADVILHFGHAHSFEEGSKIWKRGCKWYFKAIKSDHEICVIMNDRNEWDDSYLSRFEALPYKYKVLFTHKQHPQGSHTFYMEGEDHLPYVNTMTLFESKFSLKRRYDRFDFMSWFREIMGI